MAGRSKPISISLALINQIKAQENTQGHIEINIDRFKLVVSAFILRRVIHRNVSTFLSYFRR